MFRPIAAAMLTAALTLSLGAAFATTPVSAAKSARKAATKPPAAAKSVLQPKDVKCAITGEDIGAPSKAANYSVYKGRTYYFCCPSCKPTFDAAPAKYAKPAVAYPLPPAKPAK